MVFSNYSKKFLTVNLLYFSDISISIHENLDNCPSGFHVRFRNEDYNFKSEYFVARAGIYLQNVSDFSGGVKLNQNLTIHIVLRILNNQLRIFLLKNLLKKTKIFKLNLFFKKYSTKPRYW